MTNPATRRHWQHLVLVSLALLLALLPGAAAACGIPFGASLPAEKALIIHSGGQQQIITTVQLENITGAAAVVFPVPGVPNVDQPAGAGELFGYLEEATKPLVEEVERVVWLRGNQAPATGGRGVTVLGREIIGGYDVARLASDDASELQTWLGSNGYTLPAAARPILDAYVAEDWKFVAVKLAPGAAPGALDPLRMTFASDEIVYPMRLGALADSPINLQLFVLTGGRVALDGLETIFAGPVQSLSPVPSPAVAALLADAPYLTRFDAPFLSPASISGDYIFRPAADNQPFRKTVTIVRDVSPLQAIGLPGVIVCLVLMNVVALAIAYSFKRYFDSINPDKKK
ncbi:MAG: DUF2330 domain-containing protein [Chloroflexaceae bacterium]|nr:DUF2330 domain-containing protein [Chloroflexaceae bacterium]